MLKIYRCEVCGNIVVLTVAGGGVLSCCGQSMKELVANTQDAALEKHVPMVTRDGNILNVQVGDVLHPMQKEHFIQFILVKQGDKVQYVLLSPDEEPKATFMVQADEPVTVYEHCNLHGLWVKEA